MAKPRYILCCETRVIDKHSGLVSHINVLDQLHVVVSDRPEVLEEGESRWLKMFLTAVWTRQQSDQDDDLFDFDMRMYLPGEELPKTMHVGEFKFESSASFRIDVAMGGHQFAKSGVLVLESRIRKRGSGDWQSQQYEIPVMVETRNTENQH